VTALFRPVTADDPIPWRIKIAAAQGIDPQSPYPAVV